MQRLSDHVSAIGRSASDSFPESLATIFLDSSMAHLEQGNGPRAWLMLEEAVKVLIELPLTSARLRERVVLTSLANMTNIREDDLIIIMNASLHVCPWVRIHVILASVAPWRSPDVPHGAMKPPRRMREIIINNGVSAVEDILTAYCFALRDSPCDEMGGVLDVLVKWRKQVPRRPGSSPWAIASFAHYCFAHGVSSIGSAHAERHTAL
jgi:hypothetical protein